MIARPDSVFNAVAVRATATKRAASSNLTTEWFATAVLDSPVAIAKFKVKQILLSSFFFWKHDWIYYELPNLPRRFFFTFFPLSNISFCLLKINSCRYFPSIIFFLNLTVMGVSFLIF